MLHCCQQMHAVLWTSACMGHARPCHRTLSVVLPGGSQGCCHAAWQAAHASHACAQHLLHNDVPTLQSCRAEGSAKLHHITQDHATSLFRVCGPQRAHFSRWLPHKLRGSSSLSASVRKRWAVSEEGAWHSLTGPWHSLTGPCASSLTRCPSSLTHALPHWTMQLHAATQLMHCSCTAQHAA